MIAKLVTEMIHSDQVSNGFDIQVVRFQKKQESELRHKQ
jgi:hypothetical protein